MGKSCIHLFNSVAEYKEARKNKYYEPWVSFTTGVGGKVAYNKRGREKLSERPLTFKVISAGTIVWKANNTAYTVSIEYKLNDDEWTTITSNTGASAPSISVNESDTIQFRGNNATYSSGGSRYNSFSGSTAKFKAIGNIMSLIDSENFTTATTLASSNTFNYLFGYCTGLTSVKNLVFPATTLAVRCYSNMFAGCTGLTSAPELPATTLANNCYDGMFQGCTSLTTAPELPATTLADYCYSYMFRSCTGLTSAPELPATTLPKNCYDGMFQATAPELPAETLASNCYGNMFNGCRNLNYIKCLATNISARNCTYNWVYGVSSRGTFVKDANMSSWRSGVNGIPNNWAIEDAYA